MPEIIGLFWHTDYQHRRDRLINLILLWHEKKYLGIKPELETLIKRMNFAYDVRNMAAHCTWQKGKRPTSIKPLIIKFRGAQPKIRRFHLDKAAIP
jgi:hypothetical protein